MKLVTRLGLAVVMWCVLLWTGCGDVFRPVANPIVQSPPDPQIFLLALVVNGNGSFNSGSLSQINVSGDTTAFVQQVGRAPVHAAIVGSRVYVANQMSDSVTTFPPSFPSLGVTTISLPSGSAPLFVHSTQSTAVYVANKGNGSSVLPNVSVISTTSNVVTATVTVAANPMALAGTPDGSKLYCVSQGEATIPTPATLTDIATVDNTASVVSILPGHELNQPVWAVVSADGHRLYVLNQGNATIEVFDTATDADLGTLTLPPGASPNFLFFDRHNARLYATNPGANSVSIFDAATTPATALATVAIKTAAGVPGTPVSMTALSNGTRAYVASYVLSGNTIHNQVTVINSTDNQVRRTIDLGSVPVNAACNSARFRLSAASPSSSSKVYVSSCDAGKTFVINTFNDSLVTGVLSPVSAQPPPAPGQQPPPQNPVFVVAQ